MRISTTTRRCIGVAAVALLAIAGCGGDDDAADDLSDAADAAQDAADDAADAADDAADAANDAVDDAADAADDAADDLNDAVDDAADAAQDAADDGDDGDDGDGGGSISLDDIPDECIELAGDFLERIEPIVEGIDWENATLADFEGIADEFEEKTAELDEEFEDIPDECENVEFADDEQASFDMLRELAEDRAPGVIPFLEWQSTMMEGVADIAAPDSSVPADAPQSCDDAIAAVEDAMEQYDSMMSMPIGEMTKFADIPLAISTQCSPEQMNEFFEREDVQAFLAG